MPHQDNSNSRPKDVVIVGTGNAGFSAAKAAREITPDAGIVLIGEEDRPPFNRTKLSKSIATGFGKHDFQLQSPEWYPENRIELVLSRRAVVIEPNEHRLVMADGEVYVWDRLILATGSRPYWPHAIRTNAPQAHVVRTARSAEELMVAAEAAQTVLVDGVGVLGVELAEQMVKMGNRVTLVGRSRTLIPRQLNDTAHEVMLAEFRNAGVEVLLDERVQDVARGTDRKLSVALGSGEREFDLGVFAAGVNAATELAWHAGLQTNAGVLVDEHQRTSHPDIYAAGDVAEHPDGRLTGVWRAAEYQGIVAATNALGGDVPNHGRPFRWNAEVFGRYFFSVGKPKPEDLGSFDVVERKVGSVYQAFYFANGGLRGVVMMDDKARWKDYEKAVWEAWPKEQVLRAFDVPAR